MKKLAILLAIGCVGCSATLVRVPAVGPGLDMQQAVRAVGVDNPSGFSFTLISQYQQDRARVVILAEPAFKLVDMTVYATQIQVHEQAPHIPTQWVHRWGKLVQAHFLAACPPRQITYREQGSSHTLEMEVTGGLCF